MIFRMNHAKTSCDFLEMMGVNIASSRGGCELAEPDFLLSVLLCNRNKVGHCVVTSWSRGKQWHGGRGLYSLESEC